MDPLVQLLTTKYGLSPEQAQAEAARMTGRGGGASAGPSITSIPDPVVASMDPRREYARVFGTQPPDRATDVQVQQAVEAEMARRSNRQSDGPPTHPVITEPNAVSASRVAYYNQVLDKQRAGEKLSDDERAYLVRVENSTLAGRREREAAYRALSALQYRTPGQNAGAAVDASYAQRNATRRDLGATGLPPSLFPTAQAQMAGWTTPYQYPAPLAVPMKLEK